MNIPFLAHRLKKASADLIEARDTGDEMWEECLERELRMREKQLKEAGYIVMYDENEVMMMAA